MIDRAERIRIAIARKKLSYTELERLTGVSKSALQRYASGETKKIPVDVIEKIADATGVTAKYLMGWEEMDESVQSENPEYILGEGYLSAAKFAQDNGISPEDMMRIFEVLAKNNTNEHGGD